MNNSGEIKNSLISFICTHCTNHPTQTEEEVRSTLDDIILDYVATVLQDTLDSRTTKNDEEFDLEEFTEMLSAYFPGFGDIKPQVVRGWVEGVLASLTTSNPPNSQEEDPLEKLTQVLELANCSKRTQSTSSSSEEKELEKESSPSPPCFGSPPKNPPSAADTAVLTEMFPHHTASTISTILNLTNNDVDKAIQILLLDEPLPPKSGLKTRKKSHPSQVNLSPGTLKKRMVERYGFVDAQSDKREHKPILPKEEPKKMVRYREGQVVSTKGERFTEVMINKDGEEVKVRSYLSKTQRAIISGGGELK